MQISDRRPSTRRKKVRHGKQICFLNRTVRWKGPDPNIPAIITAPQVLRIRNCARRDERERESRVQTWARSLSVSIRGVLWPGSAAPSLWKGPLCKFYISYISTDGVTTCEWVTQCLHSSSFNNITVSPSCDESSPLRTAWGQLTSVFSLTWGHHSMNHNLNARAKAPPAPPQHTASKPDCKIMNSKVILIQRVIILFKHFQSNWIARR